MQSTHEEILAPCWGFLYEVILGKIAAKVRFDISCRSLGTEARAPTNLVYTIYEVTAV